MRVRREKSDRVSAVGIFPSLEIARAVLKNCRRAGFRRVAAVHSSATGRVRVEEHFVPAIGAAAVGAVVGLAAGVFAFWQDGMLEERSSSRSTRIV